MASLDGLAPDPADRFQALREASGTAFGVVLYEFAKCSELAALAEAGAKLLRGPLSIQALRRGLFDLIVIHGAKRRAARR